MPGHGRMPSSGQSGFFSCFESAFLKSRFFRKRVYPDTGTA